MAIKWFLDPPPASLAHTSEVWRRTYTSDTTVAYHLDYQSYWKRLADLIPKMKRGEKLFMMGWGFNLDQRLDDVRVTTPKDQDGWEKTLRGVLTEATKNDVRLWLLASQNLAYAKQNEPIVKEVNKMGAEAVFDKQVPPGGTHHQKAVYISSVNGEGPLLFLGGMDVINQRAGWIDAQVEIGGQGAKLGYLSLFERWSSAYLGVPAKQSWNPVPDKGPTAVQIVRSYCPKDNTGREYEEDNTYGHLIWNAITKTQRFIYIEDQFFWRTPNIDEALLKAVNERITLVVITNGDDGALASADRIRNNTSAKERLHILRYKSQRRPFVHTKAWIFDDEMAIVGSANYWDQSLFSTDPKTRTIESELGAAIVSNDLAQLRRKLWQRLAAAVGGRINFSGQGGDFFADLAALMDRSREEIVSPGAKTPGNNSLFAVVQRNP